MLLVGTNKLCICMHVCKISIISSSTSSSKILINNVATGSFSFYPYYFIKWKGRGREARLFDILVLGIGAYSGEGAYQAKCVGTYSREYEHWKQ